ncbi:MAG: hypothetical protein M1817_004667 [Caeruleum heppii]|nr:MAG: hypothetical protein M1817_004667 [Caeruleum heppii]
MDYSYFTTAPQPYSFYGLPPTPAHTNGSNSEEAFGTDTPPDFNNPAFRSYEGFGAQFNPSDLVAPSHSPPDSLPRESVAAGSGPEGELSLEEQDQQQRSSSDEKEALTPAQSRRKAQNRAAQRAFRERKERHVKTLETKLSSLEAHSSTLVTDNDRLKRELAKVATENEILRATTQSAAQSQQVQASPPVTGPQSYSPMDPKDFYSSLHHAHENKVPSHRITVAENGQRLLGAGATWDYIVSHELFRRGLVDVALVCEKLKNRAKCDGQGPTFEERDIKMAIEESSAAGGDELI